MLWYRDGSKGSVKNRGNGMGRRKPHQFAPVKPALVRQRIFRMEEPADGRDQKFALAAHRRSERRGTLLKNHLLYRSDRSAALISAAFQVLKRTGYCARS